VNPGLIMVHVCCRLRSVARALLWPSLLLALSACAVRPPAPEVDHPVRAFEQYQARVLALDRWILSGRLALDADGQQWHTNVRWRQTGESFDIRLFGPFGRDAGRVQGSPHGASLRAPDGGEFEADDVDMLVIDALGWRLPVSGMRYWVMGVPAPDSAYLHQLDDTGRLAQLEQSGWTVRFQRYSSSSSPGLPDRLELTFQDIRLRVLVDQWTLDP
jgi:outer membrane lipoprotein LolB